MIELFTVDRAGTLREGDVLNLTKYADIAPPELQVHADAMFPLGVSRHGNQYFLGSGSKGSVASPAIELLFEYVRRASFPDRPSRFTSWFATESITDAATFRARYCAGTGVIRRVQAPTTHRANMHLLTSNQTVLVYSWFAHLYWSGEAGPVQPFWEHLLVPPVEILDVVAEVASISTSVGGA